MLLQVLLIASIPAIVNAQYSCSSFWQYVRGSGGIEGILTLNPDRGFKEHNLKVILTVGAQLPSSYVGDISLIKDKQSALNDVNAGASVQYRVRFPIQNPLPKLTEVKYNTRPYCVGQKDTGNYVTTITLDHSLFSVNGQNQPSYQSLPVQQDQPVQQTYHNYQTTLAPVRQTAATRPNSPPAHLISDRNHQISHTISDFNQCGVPSIQTSNAISLIINGKPAKKGQFPWLAAYYHNGNRENGFICGGSLVSSRAVITAAHCVQNKQDIAKQAAEAFFHIGKYNIKSSDEKEFIISPVARFIIHPDWNPNSENYDGDLAIAQLSRTITFTAFIKPICLWSGSYSHNDIINKIGLIAGYGKTDAYSSISNIPYWIEQPVVDDETCLRSSPNFRIITSRRTFCVGRRDGHGPCQGDSGGGFIIQNNGKWYLRGIVSASLIDPNTYSCDTKNYAVFTDIAAFQTWIQAYI